MLKLFCMGKNIKQIYAALEMRENEIRILVGEYFNTRFNILREEKTATSAISDFRITSRDDLVQDIRKVVKQCSNKLGASVEQVILVLPALNFKRYPLKSQVVIEGQTIKKSDVARAVSNSLKVEVDKGLMAVNAVINKYSVNGIATRRLPENEVCDDLVLDIDLLCADIQMCYEYVSVVEQSGLKVLDIVLNNYAVAKEAALFEESLNTNVVILDINRTCTYLTLLSKGKLISTEIVYDGLNSIINNVYRTYYIPYNDINKLIKYSARFDSEYPDDAVYAWTEQSNTRTLTVKMLNEAVERPMDILCDKLVTMCQPIIDSGAVIVLTGEGQQMKVLCDRIKELCGCEVREYCPSTIGVRDPSLTALYGSFLVYREKAVLYDLNVSCIDLLQFDKLIDQKSLDSEGETITTKIKNLFKQYIDKGGN